MKNIKQESDRLQVHYWDFILSVLWYHENHGFCTYFFLDKKHETQSLKVLPQNKGLLRGKIKLWVFISLVQGPRFRHLVSLREALHIQERRY